MVLQRWEPFRELRRMEEEMDRVWRDVMRPFRLGRFWITDESTLPLDVYYTDDNLVVKASIPGVKPEDVEITFTGNTLTLKGEAKLEHEIKEDNYLLRERRYGSFGRSVALPESLDIDKASASYDNGILTITIPKREEIKPKSLKIHVGKTVEGKR